MLLLGLAAVIILFTILWGVSVRLENSSIADVAWGPGILAIGLTYFFTGPFLSDGVTTRALLTLGLLALWAIRLSVHIGMRQRLHGEDARYVKWRDEYEDHWWWISYFKVFLLQAVIAWVISLPIYFAIVSLAPASLTIVDYLGVVLFAGGWAFEAIADEQLRRFKADRSNKGKILDSGVWKYSRHPNYFGESVLWWGFGLIGLATGGVPGLLGPAIMTYLLIYISGVAMLEATMRAKPGYAQYAGRTPAFLPMPAPMRAKLIEKVRSLNKKPEAPSGGGGNDWNVRRY